MKVFVPTPLQSYTRQQAAVEAEGETVAEVLVDLNLRFPGIRFRMIDEQESIRPHIRIFVNAEQVWDLQSPLRPVDEMQILQALSGG